MHRVEGVARAPVVYEIAPFRNIWILRRRGSSLETLYLKRQQAIDRAAAMCRIDDRAKMVVLDAEPVLDE